MNREKILNLIGQQGLPVQFECAGVNYVFDFNFAPHTGNDLIVFELGRSDVDIPIVVEPKEGSIYFLDQNRLSFINSSFAQMLSAIAFVNEWNVPDSLSDTETALFFQIRMLEIDPHCFQDSESCWSTMLEEIENGVI